MSLLRIRSLSRSLTWLLAAGVVAAGTLAVEPADAARKTAKSAKAAKAPKDPGAYRTYAQYEKDAAPYWQSVVDMRRVRIAKRNRGEPITLADYVLTQPPHWTGAPVRRPLPPAVPGVPRLPLVSDALKMAAEQHGFVPQRPADDLKFKRAYASVATAAGLTAQQAVRIYAFETGGNGTYDVQAGLTHPSRKARAISSAVGYNQLLTANSIGLLAAQGDRFVEKLQAKAEILTGPARAAMDKKIAATRKMIAFARSVPYQWTEHEKLAQTKRAGIALHAALLDIDLGPLLQAQKLVESMTFARSKGHEQPMTGAELEMMNLTGDGNGIDLVTMPDEMRSQVPTSNFFQRYGYERNPIARRTGVVSALYTSMDAKMNRASQLPGAVELAGAFAEAADGALTASASPQPGAP
ncbi:MAG TPA: hypothetical protein VIU42_08580 [Xanthobacteraceae bacterium]